MRDRGHSYQPQALPADTTGFMVAGRVERGLGEEDESKRRRE